MRRILILILLFGLVGGALAATPPSSQCTSGAAGVAAKSGSNIALTSGTNTLCSIWYDIGDESWLSYTTATNTYNLYKPISISNGVTLDISDTKMVFNTASFMRIGYTGSNTIMTLRISNAIIDSTNGYGQFFVRGNVYIRDSTINNLGRCSSTCNDFGVQRDWLAAYGVNSKQFSMTNNIISNMQTGISLMEYVGSGNAIFDHNTVFNNEQTVFDVYDGTNSDVIITNNIFTNNLYGTLTNYPTAAVVLPAFDSYVANNIVNGFGKGDGTATEAFCAKERPGTEYFNNTISNGYGSNSAGIRIYDSWNQGGHPQNLLRGNRISNVRIGVVGTGGNRGVAASPSMDMQSNTISSVTTGVGGHVMNSVINNNVFTGVSGNCLDLASEYNSGKNVVWTGNSCNSKSTPAPIPTPSPTPTATPTPTPSPTPTSTPTPTPSPTPTATPTPTPSPTPTATPTPTPSPTSTPTPTPPPAQNPTSGSTIIDNRLRENTPDTVLGGNYYVDFGNILSTSRYRNVIWFDLSAYNKTDKINKATLSLFWYYPTSARGQSTTVEIYRPLDWNPSYVNWNNRNYNTPWNNPGGDWFDRNNAAQGNVPFDSITFNANTLPDNKYYSFNITELVQKYVDSTYANTGFFLKARDENNNYIAFRSSDWTITNERPTLVINYATGSIVPNPISYSPYDVNQDTFINVKDIDLIQKHFNEKPPTYARADVNGDGVVDILDLILVSSHINQ